MPSITLTTDWGTTDYFVAALKGELLGACPGATLVDISHEVHKFDIAHGAYIFKNAWHHFPKGTVHVVGLEPNIRIPAWLIALEYDGHYFVGSDNGFFSLVFDDLPTQACHILDSKGEKVMPGIVTLASSAGYLAGGGAIVKMGSSTDTLLVRAMIQPVTEDDSIKGTVIYIDSFGNLVTNITRGLIGRMARGRSYDIILRGREYAISEISSFYHTVQGGDLFARFNEAGYLEIGIGYGHAASLVHVKQSDTIRLEFK